jgi:hypothetical protein
MLLVASLIVSGLKAGALPVHVAIDWPTGIPSSSPARVHIHAVWMAGSANTAVSPEVEAEAGLEGVDLNLVDGVWQVQASAPGYWSQEAQVAVDGQGPTTVRLALWPAATLHGELLTAQDETPPDSLDIRLNAVPVSFDQAAAPQTPVFRPEPSPFRADLHCPINKGTWSCLGPVGLFDVRLEVPGYTPRYQWG